MGGLTVAELVATLGLDDMGFGNELDGLLGKFTPLQAGAVAAIAAIAAAFVALVAAVLHFGGEFDEAFDGIRIQTGATGKELKGLEDDFKAVVSDVPTDFASASTAIADLNTRLGLTGKPLQDLSEQFLELSRLTGTDVAENIRAGTRLFGDWSVATEDQAHVLDQLFRATQESDIGLGELMTTVVDNGATLRQLGFDLDASITMFSKFEKEGVNASKVIQGFGQLNKYATKEGRDGIDVWSETVKAIKNGTEAEAKSIGQKVFGVRAANDMVAAIREERFSYEDLQAAIKGGGDTIAKAAADTNDWRESLTVLKNKALVALEPALSAAFGGLSKGVDAASKALTSDKAKGIFGGIVDGAKSAGGALADAWGAVWPILEPVVAEFVQTFKMYMAVIMPIFRAVSGAIVQVAKWAWPIIKDIVLGALQAIAGVVRLIMALIRGDWSTAWTAIKQIVQGVAQVLRAIILALMASLRAIVGSAWNGIKALTRAAWGAIKAIVSAQIQAVKSVVSSVARAIVSALSAAWNAAKSAASAAWSGIVGVVSSGIGRVVSFVRSLPGKITGALGNLGSLLWNAGSSLISGLLDGIRSRLQDVWNEVSSIAGKIRDLKGPLDYDRVLLRPAGQAIMAGLVQGIDEGKSGLERKLAEVTRSINVSPSLRVDAALAAAGAAGGRAATQTTVIHEHYHTHVPGGSVLVGTLDEAARVLSPHVTRHQESVAARKGRGR